MIDSRAQAEVQAVADKRVASGAEIGLQVAAIHEGRTVVDVASGMSDALTGAAVAGDTLFYARPRPHGGHAHRPVHRRDPVVTVPQSTGEMP